MSDFRKLSEKVWASPQIHTDDVANAASQGFTLVINNRPDGEDIREPQGDTIAAAAHAAGMKYLSIPIDHTGMSEDKIASMAEALSECSDGKVLAYCRSGTRSTFLWSLAQASKGDEPDALIEAAASAGYDIGMMRGALEALSQKAKS